MKSNFDAATDFVLKHEGGYVNHPQDPGGHTNRGITLATLRRAGIDVDGDGDIDAADIKKLPEATAREIYRRFYWNAVQGDLLPSGVDLAIYQFGVNAGVSRSVRFAQEVLGVLADGHVGPVTLSALEKTGADGFLVAFHAKQMRHYRSLKTWQTFGKGWASRADSALTAARALVGRRDPAPTQKGGLIAFILRLLGVVK